MTDWMQYRSNLFNFNTTATDGQGSAYEECKKLGGFLAAIPDPETENFIDHWIDDHNITESTPCLWIGLRNISDGWEWQNGEKLEYANWDTDEPNYLETQHCANKQIGGFYDDTKPWFNEYCDSAGPLCGRICQKYMVDEPKQSHVVTDITFGETYIVKENSMPFAIMFPVLILVVLILATLILFICYKRRGRRLETIIEENDEVEMQEMFPLNKPSNFNQTNAKQENASNSIGQTEDNDENLALEIKRRSSETSKKGSLFSSENVNETVSWTESDTNSQNGRFKNKEVVPLSQYENVDFCEVEDIDINFHKDVNTHL